MVNISKKISIIEIDSPHKCGRGACLYVDIFSEKANAIPSIPANQ